MRIEEYVADGIRFSPLTTNYISGNPDYEEVVSDGLYQLRITQVERHNGTRYRCHGFIEDLSAEFNSDEWKLVVPCELNQAATYLYMYVGSKQRHVMNIQLLYQAVVCTCI